MKKFDEDFEKYLNLYLDDLLDEGEAAEFEKYLEENPERLAELEAYRTLDFTAKGEMLPDLPEGYWEGLESRINKRVAALPETRGYWAAFAQRFFSFNKSIKVAATALTLITVFLISRQFIVGTRISDFAERQPESMPQPALLRSEPPAAPGMEEAQEPEAGATAGMESMNEPEEGAYADTMTDRILKEDIDSERKKEFALQQNAPQTDDIGDIVKSMPPPDIRVPGPIEIEEEFPAPAITAKTKLQKVDLAAGEYRDAESGNQVALQSLADEIIAETHKQIPDSTKKDTAKYNVATAVPDSLAVNPLIGPDEEPLKDSMGKYQDKSVKMDTIKGGAESDFIKRGQNITVQPKSTDLGEADNLRTTDGIYPAAPLTLRDFPYLPPDEYSFTNPAPEERITTKFDKSMEGYITDTLREKDNLLRLEGDSLLQAYNIASEPVKKLELFRQIIKMYLVVIQESKSEPEAVEVQNLLKLGLDNNLIYYPEYNTYRDSLKVYLREKR